ncbi:CRISPR-associated RAMP Cmr2 [Pseudanabaena sp. lw0831]|uniref:type III-B CRISPR-associated protein Cas10/Cmr2 n=1 Tax=Pseudanabaena sp. lw0831 TaxID=1357935 RepID=UPI001A1E69F1|nr:type III-B CRISPR-associated protein Cas10/Cmr2 [Pseudanabaena sp. lw0831]GBO53384.1 CRISPR-associated RAMP Cmr2 [Pseudanabaena sp. lw0831]
MATNHKKDITIALAWCLAWGEQKQPQFEISVLQEMRQALHSDRQVPEAVRSIVEQVQQLQNISEHYFPETLQQFQNEYSEIWNQQTKIGLVNGGATKIKQYVFESSKIQDIRGASALLDYVNLIELKEFFRKNRIIDISQWLQKNFPDLQEALISELIVYSTGGNILAFCPAAYINDLANAIEKRYTHVTLTANSCAVGDTFRLAEIRFGLLQEKIEDTNWLDWYRQNHQNPIVQACIGKSKDGSPDLEAFRNYQSFNAITTKLAVLFNQRRSGNEFSDRPSRAYPPIFETHPYLIRDEPDRRSSTIQVDLPNKPHFSEAVARKRATSERVKKDAPIPNWYRESSLNQTWQPPEVEGWISRFNEFLEENPTQKQQYYQSISPEAVDIAQSLKHISNMSKGFVAHIYADGNNMGGYIQKIRTPERYKEFSQDISLATEYAVYQALSEHLHPHTLKNINDPESRLQDGALIHPFEIITIGGDDILLIVPANKALEIAKTICEQFEQILLKQTDLKVEISGDYRVPPSSKPVNLSKFHRYLPTATAPSQCQISVSAGLLIASDDTPIYYAKKLTDDLLKSAKKRGKSLKDDGYIGGTIDFLSMKAVTMISSNIEKFRKQGLTKGNLRFYAAPYTLHELGGLIAVVKALKKAKFPKSQLYQIRTLLENGKHTAILNYRYFRVRLKTGQPELQQEFEEAWCKAKTNEGYIAPWMYDDGAREYKHEPFYETIWRDIVDIYDFIEDPEEPTDRAFEELLAQEVKS